VNPVMAAEPTLAAEIAELEARHKKLRERVEYESVCLAIESGRLDTLGARRG